MHERDHDARHIHGKSVLHIVLSCLSPRDPFVHTPEERRRTNMSAFCNAYQVLYKQARSSPAKFRRLLIKLQRSPPLSDPHGYSPLSWNLQERNTMREPCDAGCWYGGYWFVKGDRHYSKPLRKACRPKERLQDPDQKANTIKFQEARRIIKLSQLHVVFSWQ